MPARRGRARDEAALFTELGGTGTNAYGDQTRDEFVPELKGKRGDKTYREMAREPIVSACNLTLAQLLKNAKVNVSFGSDEQSGVLVETALADMSHTWSDFLDEVTSFFAFGWSAFEIVYKRRSGDQGTPGQSSRYDDGLMGWRKLAPRPQNTRKKWEIDDEGGIRALVQHTGRGLAEIPIDKLGLFRMRSENNSPEPPPLTRGAYIPWYFLKRTRVFEGIGIERGFSGIPVISAPARVLSPDATAGELAMRQALQNIGANLRADEQAYLMLPSDRDASGNKLYDVELLTTAGVRSIDLDKVQARYTRDIAVAMLCDFLLLGHEKVGSFALADSKTSVTAMAVAGWLDGILEVFNRHLIPRLLRLNGLPVGDPPRLVRGDIETPDLQQLAAYIAALSGAGFALFPNPELEDHLLQAASLPTLSGEAAVGKRRYDRTAELAAFAGLVEEAKRLRAVTEDVAKEIAKGRK